MRSPQPTHTSPFKGFSSLKSPRPGLAKVLQFHFRLLVTMSHEDLLKAVISIIHRPDTPCAAASRYSVSNRKILEISTRMESVQEEQDISMEESYNQQQIYTWVRNNLNLPSVQGQTYTEWELCQTCERRILDKSRYSEIIVKLGVPNSTLTYFLKFIFPPLKCFYMKNLWDIMSVGNISERIVR